MDDRQQTIDDKPRTNENSNDGALVVGAGIAGMAAALHLAHLGHNVTLLDDAPTIGGSMHLLDHTFPTNSCGLCLMLPHQPAFCPTFECDLHHRVTLLPYADLATVEPKEPATGQVGSPAFRVTVRHKARFVDPDLCNGCGLCAHVCPESRPHDYEGWLAPTRAIYRPPGLRAVPDAWLIDMDYCTRCGLCVQACPTGAIDLDMTDRHQSLDAGAVLLTPGFNSFDARLKGEYGYSVYPNVLSAIEFERMVSLAGSSVARLARPSDGQAPRHIAFVHCVGSRDPLAGAGHCSSACCMFTAKQVALAKNLDPDLRVTVFHMDLRALGKDFEAYLDGVQALPGVAYRRSMPSSVHQRQQSHNLAISFVDQEGLLVEEEFDLLVLATGFAPPHGIQPLGLELNQYGFPSSDPYHPTRSTQPGVFLAGACREPKDIPDTVAEAAGAAAEVAVFLNASRQGDALLGLHGQTLDEGRTEFRDVSDEEPKVGLFVCACNGELAPLDLPQMVDWAADLHGVALAQLITNGCSAAGRASIQAAIEDQALNRVVLAGCSHRLFAGEFETLMRGCGLDPRLLARVNLRDQVLYPHASNGNGLAAKAQSLVAMAVANLNTFAGLQALTLGASQQLTRHALVLGGGAAGMTAALQLARLNIPVDLVERDNQLGGQWDHIRYQADGSDPQTALHDLMAQVQAEQRIHVHLAAELSSLEGQPGRYRSAIAVNGRQELVDHGALVVATGAQPATTDEYLYGQDPRVLTQRELERQIADGTLATIQSLVMIQCAGSREPHRPYCSRVCCTQAVKNALKLKLLRPQLDIYILFRDLRTFGFRETYYQQARDAGVVFLRYELPDKPRVEAKSGHLQVSLTELVTRLPVTLNTDLLVLSTGIDPQEENHLATSLGLALNSDGFFAEEHPKMKPLDAIGIANGGSGEVANRAGFFLAGLAHSPRFLEETIAQAQGAAMRAAAFLAPEVLADRPTSVWVDQRLCSFCGMCVDACPFQARVMNDDTRVAEVDYALCQGCGVCAVVCPNKATLQKTFEHKQLMAEIDAAMG